MHTIESGNILYSLWGYDQTNVSFYLVTRATTTTVTIQPIESERIELGDCHDLVVPRSSNDPHAPYFFSGEPIRRKVQDYGYGPSVRRANYRGAGNCYVWDGTPKQQTASGCGH